MSLQNDPLRGKTFRNTGNGDPQPDLSLPDAPQFESSGNGTRRLNAAQCPPLLPPPPFFEEPVEAAEPGEHWFKLLAYADVLRRHKTAVLVLTFIGVLVGFTYNLLRTPLYRATSSLEIEGSQDPLSMISLASPHDVSLQTQVDILKSRALLNRVKENMERKADAGGEQGPQDLLSPVRKWIGVQPDSPSEARQSALLTARWTLQAEANRDSRIVTLQCQSTDPRIAADFVNNVAREYIEQRLRERWEAYQTTSKWLSQAQMEIKAKLETSEQDLQRFARSAGILFTSETNNVVEEKLKQLQLELSKAQALRFAKEAQYLASRSDKPEALPEVLDSGPVGTYQLKLTDLQRQLAELSSTLTPEHYKIKRLRAQISELESALGRERGNILRRIRNEYETALRTENRLRAEHDRQIRLLSGQAENLIQYRILKREAETNRQLYEMTMKKGKEASIASALRASDARVIDPAAVPESPHLPILPINLAIGFGGGLVFGSGFVIVRDRLKAAVQLPGNLSLLWNVRELGVIPSAKTARLPHRKASLSIPASSLRALPPAKRRDRESRGRSLELVIANQTDSSIAEAFRATMASILFSPERSKGSSQAIVVTSPSPGDGKTTVLCNIAQALAEIDRRVLLIDGDMRIPRLHDVFKVSNEWGLGDLLQEKKPISGYPLARLALLTEVPNLFVLPSGSARANLSRLLYSARLSELLERCRSEFTDVLIDAPPVLNVPDARILSRAADSMVLVFRAAKTTREEAEAVMRCLEEDGAVVLGTVLNDWNRDTAAYGSYGSYGSYHSSYSYGPAAD